MKPGVPDSGEEKGIVQGEKRKFVPLLPVGSALIFCEGEKSTAHRRGGARGWRSPLVIQ